MVGLADIPCVGVFVERVSENTVAAVFRGLKYMLCYKALVKDLDSEIGKLNIEKDEMSRKVKKEKANGKDILDHVLQWQIDVEEIQKRGKEPSPSCSCIQPLPIPNPLSRFRIGRNAAKKSKAVTELEVSGKDYLNGEIAVLPEVINMPNSDTTFEEFPSRNDAYRKLWDSLVAEDSPLIHGICGMAGLGKTRMVEKFWEEAMKEKIFSKVVRVDVGSEKLDYIKLQDQAAARLNCKLESQDPVSRASQLENSLRNEGKVLLILDDVWTEIRLSSIIGGSFGDGSSSSKGSKILLTSRRKEVCLSNDCELVVEIETLTPDEALSLFKKAVGPNTINSLQDIALVRNVCNECGHLPLLIHAVGKALKGKRRTSWTDAHNQLVEGKFEKIAGVDPQVYTGIKLSIDYLQNDDAKSCLFLCSMFPEDANIDMKMLIQLATGSELIPDGESRILNMVEYLKISSLLLNSGKDDKTKVHDVIRDVSRSIAFTDSKYAFLQVTCNSSRYLPFNANYSTRRFLRLDAETDNVHFDEHLVFPDLHTLWLQSNDHPQQFSGGFFSMFANLSCLMLQKVNIALEKFSLQPLGNLGTLSLLECDLSNTDVSLLPRKLKTLCICECELPELLDVANLKYLQKLEIQQRRYDLVLVSNFISSLPSLKELHILNGFVIDHEEYQKEPIVMEVSKLTYLTSLNFYFKGDNTSQGTNMFPNIDRYNIFVGKIMEYEHPRLYSRVPSTRWIDLYGNHWKPWQGLMARAEEVRLYYSDVEVSSICNGHTRAFEDLRRLYIYECNNLGYLASISQDEIQYSLQLSTCFSNLTILDICRSSKMKYLFCNNIAKNLVQLQELHIEMCDSMEVIIMNEGDTSDAEIINFRKLKLLKILDMPRLASFYAGKENEASGSTLSTDNSAHLSAQYRPFFDHMVAFPSLEQLLIENLPNTSVVWGKDCYDDTVFSFCKLSHLTVRFCDKLETAIPQAMSHRLNKLEYIYVFRCDSLRSMFSPSVASNLTQLKKMEVLHCEEMRELIGVGEQIFADGILFPELTFLSLCNLSLTSFWSYQSGKVSTCKVPLRLPQLLSIDLSDLLDLKSFFYGENFEFHMPALKKVHVSRCGISTLFTLSVFREFLQLEELRVWYCEFMERIVEEVRSDETSEINGKSITSSQLSSIYLLSLPNLKSFSCARSYVFNMPKLRYFEVRGCDKIEYFSSTKTNTPLVYFSCDWCSPKELQDLNDIKNLREDD